MGLHQTKRLLHSKKKLSKKMERPSTEWEKIFAINKSDIGLISKIYKEPYNSTSGKQTTPLKGGRAIWEKNIKNSGYIYIYN